MCIVGFIQYYYHGCYYNGKTISFQNIFPGTGTAEVKRLSRNTSSYLRRWCKLPFIGVLHVIFTHHSVRILLSSVSFLIKTPTHSCCREMMTASAANRSGKMTDGPSTQHVTALG